MSKLKSQGRDLQPIEEYWLALGQFVHQFAALERMLQTYLMIEAGVNHNVAKAIFSGVKIDQGKDHIKRLRQVSGKPKSELLDRIFSQITVVTKARNDILHHGANFAKHDSNEGFVSNAFRVTPDREYSFPVSPEILHKLTIDTNRLQVGIAVMMTEGQPIPDEVMANLRKSVEAPWSYTPPGRSQTDRPPPKGGRRQKVPPQSSPE